MALLTLPLDAMLLIYLAAVLTVAALVAAVVASLVAVGLLGYLLWRFLRRHEIEEQQRLFSERRTAERARWDHAYRWWNELQYCYRCHGVFLPGNEWQYAEVSSPGTTVPSSDAWSLAQRLAEYADRYHTEPRPGPDAGEVASGQRPPT
jgi:hypothetical protein